MILAIDSSAGASVAVLDGARVLAQWNTAETNTHAEVLADAVAEVLRQAEVTGAQVRAVVVGVGPGPFTGLRVGLALAQSLAAVWQVPLHGICSLDSPARRAAEHRVVEAEFLVATDARRREVYWAHYRARDSDAVLVAGPHVGPAAELPNLPVVGIGASLYPATLNAASTSAASWLPHAAELGQVAQAALVTRETAAEPQGEPVPPLRTPRPLYLRESDAQVPAQMRARPTAGRDEPQGAR